MNIRVFLEFAAEHRWEKHVDKTDLGNLGNVAPWGEGPPSFERSPSHGAVCSAFSHLSPSLLPDTSIFFHRLSLHSLQKHAYSSNEKGIHEREVGGKTAILEHWLYKWVVELSKKKFLRDCVGFKIQEMNTR